MTAPSLADVLRAQLAVVTDCAHLSACTSEKAQQVLSLVAEQSMARPLAPTFAGLSRINASGLPFQWCFVLGGATSAVRFLTECGAPFDSPRVRCRSMLDVLPRVQAVLGMPHEPWLEEELVPRILPPADEWPSHWRSGVWLGIGMADRGAVIKPYFNLNRGAPIDRWKRVSYVLRALGRLRSLELLCRCSGEVSSSSWPVGLAIDVRQDGTPGRLKVYFRCGDVGLNWLERWYVSLGASGELPFVRGMLDALPRANVRRHPAGSFVVSLEFHEVDGVATLKTDMAIPDVTRGDAGTVQGIRRLASIMAADPMDVLKPLDAIGASPCDGSTVQTVRFIGIGYEPDGSRHLNVYVEPPIAQLLPGPGVPCEAKPQRLSRLPATAGTRAALLRALDFLATSQHDGRWSDYQLPVGTSDRWTTAYVLCQLSAISPHLLSPALKARIEDALCWLAEVRAPDGGWGFNSSTSSDADSTSFAVLALRRYGRAVPIDAYQCILRCLTKGGGFGTYSTQSGYGTWTQASAEVTARAACALQVFAPGASTAALSFLKDHQDADGMWRSYWWTSPLLATLASLEAFADAYPKPPVGLLHQTLIGYVAVGAFDAALRLSCCASLGLTATARSIGAELVGSQLKDGSWQPSAYLRLPHRTVAAPWNVVDSGPLFTDTRGIFTTATVVESLARIC